VNSLFSVSVKHARLTFVLNIIDHKRLLGNWVSESAGFNMPMMLADGDKREFKKIVALATEDNPLQWIPMVESNVNA
jgi:hypothetical protein